MHLVAFRPVHHVIQGMQHRSTAYGKIREELSALSRYRRSPIFVEVPDRSDLHYRLYLPSNVSSPTSCMRPSEQHLQARWVMDAWEQAITELLPADVAHAAVGKSSPEQFFVLLQAGTVRRAQIHPRPVNHGGRSPIWIWLRRSSAMGDRRRAPASVGVSNRGTPEIVHDDPRAVAGTRRDQPHRRRPADRLPPQGRCPP